MKNLILAAVVLSVATGCEKNGVFCYNGNGNIITEQRQIDSFDEIELSMDADVHLTQSSSYSVSVTASENLMNVIKTEVHGSTLCIETKSNKCIHDGDIDVYVTMPDLSKIKLSGSGNINCATPFNTNNLELTISGSGNINMDSLSAVNCFMNISGSGNMQLNGASSGQHQEIKISGSGNVNTLNHSFNSVDVSISGSGSASVWAVSDLKTNISGSGDVIYKGNPIITSSNSGSGSVRPY
jgi:hypothetical protein